jgi:hypothetical protein
VRVRPKHFDENSSTQNFLDGQIIRRLIPPRLDGPKAEGRAWLLSNNLGFRYYRTPVSLQLVLRLQIAASGHELGLQEQDLVAFSRGILVTNP